MSDHLKRANTCASECAETNHPGREHVEYAAERIAEARSVVAKVDADIATATELAAVIDPEPFADNPKRDRLVARSEVAALQWAARRHVAIEHASRVLRSDWLPDLLAARVRQAQAEARSINADHLARQREWSRATFGPGSRLLGVLDHIRKELTEIEAAPDDVTEWVDVIILAFDGAWRAGWEPQQIIDAIMAKQARNEAREWPDWRTMSEDQAIEHVRTEADR